MHSQKQLNADTKMFHVHVLHISCRQQAEAREPPESSPASHPALPLAVAELQVRRGLLLLNTDQLADGEAAVAAGVPVLEAALPRHALLLLRAYQALALQHGERDELEPALQRLQAAEALYRQHLAPRPAHQGKPEAAAAAVSGSAAASAGSGASAAAAAEAGAAEGAQAPSSGAADQAAGGAAVPASAADQAHTMTLFYLAQVHGQMGHQKQAVAYCAATLARQVTQGALRPTHPVAQPAGRW